MLKGKRPTFFSSFYKTLYSGDQLDPQAQNLYLRALQLPQVTPEWNDILIAPFSTEEVSQAIKNLKPHKAPGPDGYTANFYKTFSSELVPHLTQLFNTMAQEGSTSPTMAEAVITILPKPGKDPQACPSYRPIALLNLDAKLYSAILAKRLNDLMPHLIHPDQSGFIKGRQTHDNTRHIAHLIEKANKRQIPAVLVGLDAEKAFDRVDWAFLFNTLQAFGFSPVFLRMLRANYSLPSSRVIVNGTLSQPFPHSRGTRQCCPLSPLLFALSIEPLAIAIRTNPAISGIPFAREQHKITLFADDILLSLTNPESSLPALHNELNTFESVAGLKINTDKSYILNLTLSPLAMERLRPLTSLQWTSTSIQYLGIHLTPTLEQLYRANFPPLLAAIQH